MKCAKNNETKKPPVRKRVVLDRNLYKYRSFVVIDKLRDAGMQLSPMASVMGGPRLYKDQDGRKVVIRTAAATTLVGRYGERVYRYRGWTMDLGTGEFRNHADILLGLFGKDSSELLCIKRIGAKELVGTTVTIAVSKLEESRWPSVYEKRNMDRALKRLREAKTTVH